MATIEIVFAVCFFLGLGYAVISALLGDILGGGESVSGGFDAGHDVAGHVDTGSADHGTIHFSPLSPIVLAMFVTSFGAAGMICLKVFGLPQYTSVAVAGGTGLVVAFLTFLGFAFIFRVTQGSSESRQSESLGQEAEVITTIPAEGLGVVAYTSRGSRYTAPAKAIEGKEIKVNSTVVVEKIAGNTFQVRLKN
ncbi:MAG: hypothetical protein A2Z34_03160 [Planctomycetes bacterium RBG_16_59_8]|nr:MAG: hypothetical protein A2Z34_03160 [Planctomycetes bacterium RBG_16_59_8]